MISLGPRQLSTRIVTPFFCTCIIATQRRPCRLTLADACRKTRFLLEERPLAPVGCLEPRDPFEFRDFAEPRDVRDFAEPRETKVFLDDAREPKDEFVLKETLELERERCEEALPEDRPLDAERPLLAL